MLEFPNADFTNSSIFASYTSTHTTVFFDSNELKSCGRIFDRFGSLNPCDMGRAFLQTVLEEVTT